MSRKRWVLLSIALFFLVAGGVGWWWVYSLLHYDVTEAELGVEVGFFDFNEAIQVPKTGIDFSQKRTSAPENSGLQGQMNTQQGQGPQNSTGSQSSTSPEDVPASGTQNGNSDQSTAVEESPLTSDEKLVIIKEEYTNSFTQLQNLALSRIDTLVQLAKEEYLQKKDTKGFSKVDLASKYMSAGNKLEQEVTKVFYEVLEQMKKDLQNNQLPLDIVAEAEKEYKAKIKQKKDELLSKVF